MSGSSDQQREIEALRARIVSLERELIEQVARANVAVAVAQERVYWLDRWNLDLNALMRQRGASELRAVVRAVRAVARWLAKLRRQLQKWRRSPAGPRVAIRDQSQQAGGRTAAVNGQAADGGQRALALVQDLARDRDEQSLGDAARETPPAAS